MSKQSKNNKPYLVLMMIFIVLFLCCVMWLMNYFLGLKRAENQMQNIQESYISAGSEESSESLPPETPAQASEESSETGEQVESTEEEEPAPDLSIYGVTDKTVDFEALKAEVNPDIYAWITVPGTVIDYPVLQHPDEMDYYLEYNLDGSKGYPGCIYTQRMNAKDFNDPNTVLYGHNMKNGTMFAALHKYKDPTFFNDNKYIHIYTEDNRILVYEIFAAYVYTDMHLLIGFDLHTESGIQYYFDSIRTNEGISNVFDNDIELDADSKVITLSTCISNKPKNRFLVQGVLIAEGEQQ